MISKIPTTLTEILEAAQQDCSVNKCRFVTPDRRPFSDIAPIAFIERISDVSFSDFTFDFHDKMKSHKLLKKPLIALRYTPCQIRFQPTIKDEYGAIFFYADGIR